MAFAFLVGSVVPIVPWLLASTHPLSSVGNFGFSPALVLSVSITVLVLFAMGAGKSVLAHRSSLRGGAEVAAVGLLAASVGFVLGSVLPRALGLKIVGGG